MRDRAEHFRRDLGQGVEQKVHRPVGLIVGQLDEPLDGHRSAPPGRREFEPVRGRAGPPARTALARPPRCRSGAGGTCRSAAPIPSRSHSRSNVHAPPAPGVEDLDLSPAVAAAAACSGVRNREIDDTNRASRPVDLVAAEVVDHLRDRVPLTGCARWRNCRTTPPSRPGSSPGLPQEHATTQPLTAAHVQRHATSRVLQDRPVRQGRGGRDQDERYRSLRSVELLNPRAAAEVAGGCASGGVRGAICARCGVAVRGMARADPQFARGS